MWRVVSKKDRDMRIETERLVLREWQFSDVEKLIMLAGQEHIEYWMPDWREYDKHASGWIKMVLSHYEINNPLEKFISWAVTLKEGGKLIGQVGIGCFNELGEKEIGIGYWMDIGHTGQGYMTEAINAVAQIAFKTYGYTHVIATIQPNNLPSRRVVEKAGFRYIKTVEFKDADQPGVLPFCYYKFENPAWIH